LPSGNRISPATPVAIDHREARIGIPRAGERRFTAATPLRVDVVDQKAFLRGLRHLDLYGQRRIERVVVFLLEVVLVTPGGRPACPSDEITT